MSLQVYIVLAIILLGWYILSSDNKPQVKREEAKPAPTIDEVLNDTEQMYIKSTEDISKMFEQSKKELDNIHKEFLKELKGNSKTTTKAKGAKTNV